MIAKELIKKCGRNDRVAQKELYDLLAPTMFAVCMKCLKNKESAEDVFQDSFVHLFNKINQFRFEGSFEGWTRKIFVRRCIEQLKKNKIKYSNEIDFEEFDEIPVESQSPNMLDKLQENDILKLIDSLSNGYKTVFRMHALDGFPHKEIGKMLKISEGTSKSQFARARYSLQKLVEKNNATC